MPFKKTLRDIIAGGLIGAAALFGSADKAKAEIIPIHRETALSSPLVGIAADADNLYAHDSLGIYKDSGKDLTFENSYFSSGDTQDAANWTNENGSYSLELKNGDLQIINNSNEFDHNAFGVSSSYVGVGDALNLNGTPYASLVKNLGDDNYRVDLLNLNDGNITQTNLAFTHDHAITGLGSSQGNSLENIAFLFTDDNKQILEGGVNQGIVASYDLNTDIGNLTDIALDGNNLYVSTQIGPWGAVGVSNDYTPSIPEPATVALLGTGALFALRYRAFNNLGNPIDEIQIKADGVDSVYCNDPNNPDWQIAQFDETAGVDVDNDGIYDRGVYLFSDTQTLNAGNSLEFEIGSAYEDNLKSTLATFYTVPEGAGALNVADSGNRLFSICETPSSNQPCDFNGDGRVDQNDLVYLCGDWLTAGSDLETDLNGDQIVNLGDFAIFSNSYRP